MERQPTPSDLLARHFQESLRTWDGIGAALRSTFANCDDLTFQKDRPATKFILAWARDLKSFHSKFGKLFGRRKRPPIADDFTAAVALTLDHFLTARGYPSRVGSERPTHKRRGATRPDVSVHTVQGELVATIECKTDFGFARNKWKERCEAREARLVERFPGCRSYLCVLSSKNWDPTDFVTSPHFKVKWLCLTDSRVGRLSDPLDDKDVFAPIEPVFVDILGRLKAAEHI